MRKQIYKASVFLAVVGLTLMYFSSLYLQLEKVDIGQIEKSWSGKNVKIQGNVTDFSRSSGHAFIDLQDDTGEMMVVDFDSDLKLEEGESIAVTGHVSIYRGQLEVIADEVMIE